MKMLGNDVLTQDEFDTFYKNEFETMKEAMTKRMAEMDKGYQHQLKDLEKTVKYTRIVTVAAAVLAVVSLFI